MKRAFTLIEMLVVIAVLVTLMSIVFRISGIGADSDCYTRTIVRMQRLENCLSGYHAAFGSYPPVKLHGTRDFYQQVSAHGIQTDERNEGIWNWDARRFRQWSSSGSGQYYQQAEVDAWRQVQAACVAQPVGCNFPFPTGYREMILLLSDQFAELAQEGGSDYGIDERLREKLLAGFDDGGAEDGSTGRFNGRKNKVDWRDIQLFRFGVMSYLLPRYLVMMNGTREFFTGGFAQWNENNVIPCDPFNGQTYDNWGQIKDYAEKTTQRSQLARVANIPSQAICARWIPNLEGICYCVHPFTLFGVDIRGDGNSLQNLKPTEIELYSPRGEDSLEDQYILDGVTIRDGWWREFYYYSPEPYQTYTVWSAGKNGRTFPPWISRHHLSSKANECVSAWVGDDIIHMSN